MRTDSEVKMDVLEELAWEPRVDERHIKVDVRNGVVTLTGRVDSYAEKLAARRAALRVAGVKAVALDMEVSLLDAHRRTDTQIADAATMALNWSSVVPRNAIQVTAEDGVLTLTGEVAAAFQRQAAEKAVRHLVGVKAVQNRVLIKPAAVPRDIKSKIVAALHRQAQKDARDIEVAVDGGTITLSGPVSSSAERKAAVEAAWAAPGAAQVVDYLEVRV